MKLTFPHMGNIYLAVKALCDGLGIEYVIPPINNKLSLKIGSLYAPEETCFPFKLMIGNYIQAIEQGADTLLITGSCSSCNHEEYCKMQMNLLNKLGYDLEFIVIDTLNEIGIKELYRNIYKITSISNKNIFKKYKALSETLQVINLISEIEATAYNIAGYEKFKGECKKILSSCKINASMCNNPTEMIKVLKCYKEKMNHVSININKNPLKIAIIGEMYTVTEPFSNLYIEDKFMEYGVSSFRSLIPSCRSKNTALLKSKYNSFDKIYDGAIQIFPIGCLTETISNSTQQYLSTQIEFPVISLVVDETTNEASYMNRVKAFIDLLEKKRDNATFMC